MYMFFVAHSDSSGAWGGVPIVEDAAHMVLPGHRSIVNQTRYSKVHRVLASSGVEKIVKVCKITPPPF